jgi:tetratricopeptide (TPR) repeat protein
LADKDPRAHVRLAQTLFQLEQPDQAYQEFAAATKLSDETPVPEIMMARLYEQSGKSEKATEWMKLVVQRHPNNASAHVGVAEWYWRNNKLEEAQKHAAKALEIKPDLLDAKLIRGIVARFQKDYPEAEKQFEAAHLAAPANFLAANQLALVLAEQQDTEKLNRALQLAQLNAKQHQQEPEVLATLGTVLYKGGRVDDAERFLRQLASMNVMSGDAAYYLGQILAKKNQTDEAKRLLRVALSSQGPFVNRDAAQSLLDQLSKPPGG